MDAPREPQAKPSAVSAWAFWLGVVSLIGLGPLTGLLAVALGALAYRRERAGERSTLALAGIVCGALGSALGTLILLGGVAYLRWPRPQPVVQAPPVQLPAPRALPKGHPPLSDRRPAADAQPSHVERVGAITLVEVADDDERSLAELAHEHRRDGATTLIYVRAEPCAPCTRFERALREAPMQQVLGGAVLLAVDVFAFDPELRRLRINSRDVPTFVRLRSGDELFAEDAITGAEWDADTAANIAAVFGPFVSGTLQERRQPPPFVGISL